MPSHQYPGKYKVVNILKTKHGTIIKTQTESGLKINEGDKIEIGFRTKEKLYIYDNKTKKTLKNIMNEKKIPVHLRQVVPLLFINDELIGIVDWFMPKHLIKKNGYTFSLKK